MPTLLLTNPLFTAMKMLWLLLLPFSMTAAAQSATFQVRQFSPDYHARIFIQDTSEVFSPGWVAVYNSHTHQELIRVTSDELALSLHNGQALANVQELPYGEQSLVIYEDFNFDGIKDFAIEDGQTSCYHGPSFQVYLAAGKGFELSTSFTALAQEYCGMFRTDHQTRRIYTMTKSGCCWHQFSEFSVSGNEPVAEKVVEEDFMRFPFGTITTETRQGSRMVSSSQNTINLDDEMVKVHYRFNLERNGKKAVVCTIDDRLYYILLRSDDTVEFAYPAPEAEIQPNDFRLVVQNGETQLHFTNKNARYQVSDAQGGRIDVTVNGKTTLIRAEKGTSTGQLGALRDLSYANLQTQP